jgi:hypothetical protein
MHFFKDIIGDPPKFVNPRGFLQDIPVNQPKFERAMKIFDFRVDRFKIVSGNVQLVAIDVLVLQLAEIGD